jgi:hypothetical protein
MFDGDRFWHDVSTSYQHHILDQDKQAQFFILAAFLITFTTVRVITHLIRGGHLTHVFHNVSTKGGTHLHHLVPGILLLLLSGFLGIGFPDLAHRELLAILFGIGAALTLDEFALWLHLEDVYWAKQGRQSIDAVVIAATLVGLTILGWGFWLDLGRATGRLIGVS